MTEDDKLDETLDETFPASDPPGNTIETGIRLGVDAPRRDSLVILDRREANRFETIVDGQVAFLEYERRPGVFIAVHTEVPESLRGRGIGGQLAEAALQSARSDGLRIVAQCPFVRAYLKKHHE